MIEAFMDAFRKLTASWLYDEVQRKRPRSESREDVYSLAEPRAKRIHISFEEQGDESFGPRSGSRSSKSLITGGIFHKMASFLNKFTINTSTDQDKEDLPSYRIAGQKALFSHTVDRRKSRSGGNILGNKENDGGSFINNLGKLSLHDEVTFLGVSPQKLRPVTTKIGSAIKITELKTHFSTPIDASSKFRSCVTSTVARHVDSPSLKHQFVKSKQSNISVRKSALIPRTMNYESSSSIYRRVHNRPSRLHRSSATSSCLKRLGTLHDSYRLEDMIKYKRLLQQHTSSQILPSGICPHKKLTASSLFRSSKLIDAQTSGAIIREYFNLDWTNEKKEDLKLTKENELDVSKSRFDAAGRVSSSPEVITIEEDQSSQTENGESSKKCSDDDIVITKEILHKPPRTNALEEKLARSPFYTGENERERNEKYDWRKLRREQSVEIVLETKRHLEECRKARDRALVEKLSRIVLTQDITYPTKVQEVSEATEEVFPTIETPEIQKIVHRALKGGPPSEVLANMFNIQVTRKDIGTLFGLNWLNDEVVNFYMNLLMERAKNDNGIKTYAFNTFFYPKLIKTGYSSVRRWTKKVDIFGYELLLIPIHLGMHWCLATIDFRECVVRYYDSMLGDNYKCLKELLRYLGSEHQDKKKSFYETSRWTIRNMKDIPQQMNGSDCGMFSCMFAEYLSRGAAINFSQDHMPYFRRRMIYEIVTKTLM